MDALPANRSWQPSRSHGTYQHETITSRSRQLVMMGTWLPEICWGTSRREIKHTKVTSSWFLLSTLSFLFSRGLLSLLLSRYRTHILGEKAGKLWSRPLTFTWRLGSEWARLLHLFPTGVHGVHKRILPLFRRFFNETGEICLWHPKEVANILWLYNLVFLCRVIYDMALMENVSLPHSQSRVHLCLIPPIVCKFDLYLPLEHPQFQWQVLVGSALLLGVSLIRSLIIDTNIFLTVNYRRKN